jgi:transcriptional regulator with XRE-family HTH domain
VEQIADRIVSLRNARGMSATEFAAQLGISVRRLARIERGERPVSLNLLLHACRVFRKSMDYFFASTFLNGPFHHVTRAAELLNPLTEAPARLRPLTGTRCFSEATFKDLAAGFEDRGLHPYLVRLKGRASDARRLLRHRGQEFVYVLRGEVNLVTKVGDDAHSIILLPGDSCLIDTLAPHRWVQGRSSPYDAPGAEMITVLWHPGKTE